MKKKTNKKSKIPGIKWIIPILAVSCISTAAYAVSASVNTSEQQIASGTIQTSTAPTDSEGMPSDISGVLQQSNLQLPEDTKGRVVRSDNYEDWQQDEESSNLTHEEELVLYNQGYDFSDITEAEHLSMLSGKTPQEILGMKGKTTFDTEKQADGTSTIVKKEVKTWQQVMDTLGVKDQSITDVLGVSSQQIDDMKRQGLTDAQIQEASALAFNYKKDYKDILKEMKNGKKIEDLQKEYWEENMTSLKNRNTFAQDDQAENEKILKKQYNITDDDIAKCKQYNITSTIEIAYAKDMANKHNVTLEKVLELKKQYNDWNKVSDTLGGGK